MNKFLLQTNKKFLSIDRKGSNVNIKLSFKSFRNIYLSSKNTNTNQATLYNNRDKRITLIPKNISNHYRSFSTKNDTDKPSFIKVYMIIGTWHAILFAILACVLMLEEIFSNNNNDVLLVSKLFILMTMSCVWPLIWLWAIISSN